MGAMDRAPLFTAEASGADACFSTAAGEVVSLRDLAGGHAVPVEVRGFGRGQFRLAAHAGRFFRAGGGWMFAHRFSSVLYRRTSGADSVARIVKLSQAALCRPVTCGFVSLLRLVCVCEVSRF